MTQADITLSEDELQKLTGYEPERVRLFGPGFNSPCMAVAAVVILLEQIDAPPKDRSP